ncbi:class F sortase [Blastococcus sp. MG754426]|uniref:class F sortase n=1 Tax=Blastococcus sp. MG754426 TaxID=2570317 RepID=UPI002107A29D|nr:class F sortase [Blastococcus sp. MG754426]
MRVAHLSPDTPAVDVSLTPAAPPGELLTDPGPDLATGMGYGGVSAFAELPAGAYAVSVRAAGSPATTPPVLSARLELSAGQARTVTLAGAFADLALQPLDDDLSAPPAGAARVRVLGAAPGTGPLDVVLDGGPPLAEELRSPGAATPVTVPGGRYRARLPSTGDDAEVDLPAGSVRTVLVLARPGGGIELRVVADATGPAVRPAGGVDAGGGPAGPLAGRLLRAVSAAVGGPAAARPVPAAPVRLRVPAAGIDASVVGAGLDGGGALSPPADPALVGWFTGSPRPGATGPAVLTGHVDWAGRPGALGRLDRVAPGDEVLVEGADGGVARFRVTAVERYAKDAFPGDAVYAPTPAAELRVITCGGAFDAATGSYRDNVVVSARLAG